MGIIKLPESFQNMLMSPEFEELFQAMGLAAGISQLPLNGVDICRVYEMLNNMKSGRATRIIDLLGRATTITLTEDIVAEALQLSITNFPVKARRAHSDLAKIFENPKKTGNTYAQMKNPVMANHIRVIQNMFKLAKQQRHIVPHLAFTHAVVEDGIHRRLNAKKSWVQYFHAKILESAKQNVHHRYIACTEYLTRLAYHLIGAADLLPEPFRPIQPIIALTSPTTKPKKTKKAEPQRSASPVPSKFRSDLDEPASPTTELRGSMKDIEDRLKKGIQPATSSEGEAVEDSEDGLIVRSKRTHYPHQSTSHTTPTP